MKDYFIRWFAGFIDGEGSIVVTHSGERNIRIILAVSNTHLPTMKLIYKHCGGKFQDISKWEEGRNWRNSFRIHWNNKEAQRILKILFPYLITKKKQAGLALQLTYSNKGGRRISLDEKYLRNGVMYKVKRLNKKEWIWEKE